MLKDSHVPVTGTIRKSLDRDLLWSLYGYLDVGWASDEERTGKPFDREYQYLGDFIPTENRHNGPMDPIKVGIGMHDAYSLE